MKNLKILIRLLIYGWLLNCHLKKKHKFNFHKNPTVMNYHFEMAKYYYEKIYEKEWE